MRLILTFLLLLPLCWPVAALANPIRIKDLVGYGLVVGLNGIGDGLRNAPFTEEILSNILERLGVNATGGQCRLWPPSRANAGCGHI